MWLLRLGPPTLSSYPAKFGDHRYCGRPNIRFYICHMITWSKRHLTRYVGSSDGKLQPCQVWWPQVLLNFKCKVFEFFTWPPNQKVTWLWRWHPSIASYCSAKFDGHRYCGRPDIRIYICHVTTGSKGHLTRYVGSSDGKLPPC